MNLKKSNITKAGQGSPRDETRRRLIEAGLEVFGRHGYEAATTRMLAKAAGANLAAIPYHFGGKEGLYHAVVQHLGALVLGSLEGERSGISEVMKNPEASREELFGALESLIRGIGRVMISSDMGGQFAPIIMREQLSPSNAFDRLYDDQICSLHEAITALAARLSGLSPESDDAIIRAHAIIGQVVAFRVMRETARRRLRWETFDQEKTEKVCDILVENVRRTLCLELNGAGT